MRVVQRLVLLAFLACGPAAAQPAASINRQAIYDAAQAAYDQKDWTVAAGGFVQLLPTDARAPLRHSEAVIAARYAAALLPLGRLDEAQIWIDRALQAYPQEDATDVATAWLTKGEIERFRYDYPAAIAAYDKADALATALESIDMVVRARVGEAIAGATVDPAHVSTKLAALLADPAFAKAADKTLLAQVEDLKARADINLGDKAAAARLAEKAVSDSGGLTEKVTTMQIAIRADAGIISRLRGDNEATRRYLTYTGAGHLEDASWIHDHAGDLPVCDGPGGDVQPDDSVVVAFAIASDGHVAGALPIRSTRRNLRARA